MNTYVNLWAVLVSAIASMVVGSLWYGPFFGKAFMHAMGMDQWSKEKQDAMMKSMAGSYIAQFIASVVMFYVFARIAGGLGTMTIGGGLGIALWVWVGFIVPIKLADALWGGKWTLFWLSISNMLVTLLITGAIVGGWR